MRIEDNRKKRQRGTVCSVFSKSSRLTLGGQQDKTRNAYIALKSEKGTAGHPEGPILSGQTLTCQVMGRMSPAVRMTVKASGSKRQSSHVLGASPQAQFHNGTFFSRERTLFYLPDF